MMQYLRPEQQRIVQATMDKAQLLTQQSVAKHDPTLAMLASDMLRARLLPIFDEVEEQVWADPYAKDAMEKLTHICEARVGLLELVQSAKELDYSVPVKPD
jgi:formylmethanofuran dehydrogenase subunit E-like metal-binding protein